MHPYKIVFITTVSKSYNQLRGQLSYLSMNGFIVHCISSPGPELDNIVKSENVKIHPVLINRNISIYKDIISIYKIYCIIKKINPHIVHAGTPKGGFLGIISAYLASIQNRLYISHGLRLSNIKGPTRRILYFTEKLACRLATKVYCVSKSLRDQYIKLHLCEDFKLSVPLNGSINGVDGKTRYNPRTRQTERITIRMKLNITNDSVVIGFVGRIVKDKGFNELIQAWEILKPKRSDLHLLIVGPYETEDPVSLSVRNIIETHPHIHLIGAVSNPAPYYAAMDVYVLPSYREGLPTTVLEASSMELPVVATRVTGCIDAVVDNYSGILVEVREPNELAKALQFYYENPAKRILHGKNGRERVMRDFKPEATWEYMKNEFGSLLHSR